MRWNKGMTIAAAVVGSILILWSGKSEQPPSGWESLQLGTEKPTIEQELPAVLSATSVQGNTGASSGTDSSGMQTGNDARAGESKELASVGVEGDSVVQTTSQTNDNPPDTSNSNEPVTQGTNSDPSVTSETGSNSNPPVVEEASDNGKIDVNTAPVSKLTDLPGIGEKKAQAIVDYRNAHGPFAKVSDLTKVKGIGMKMLEKMAPYVQIR
ncbi:helix-hairpin-helix domain-containing protein [Paenibacillus xylanexedens]|uniref:ComEA family DNA-binding protein n=1 Tax=Paenibacillus xylanexedens TaxID=528191 RepID=UPI001C8EE59B|nr:helix-hairpin-helix domain-containing protein [Paenibacillus xylanexedens]MBY0117464.1 helix-hairpin-helix domain-containing protein [Paenibacillus xylanexedens]